MQIYTDGGCSGNPGPGGWAFVFVSDVNKVDDGFIREKWGGERSTTNNRMELTAVINALQEAGSSTSEKFTISTDSQYVKKGITEWIHNWKANGWKTSGKAPVKNQDLWQKLDALNSSLSPEWRWVKGHAGDKWNERCDALTQTGIASVRPSP
jgi:ribonuclease HI